MTTSDYIYKLIRIGEINDLTFVLHDESLPKNISGRVHYHKRVIRINEHCAINALMVVAHELGHFFSFTKNKGKKTGKYQREILAYLYGWGLLKKINAPISKNQWIDIHS